MLIGVAITMGFGLILAWILRYGVAKAALPTGKAIAAAATVAIFVTLTFVILGSIVFMMDSNPLLWILLLLTLLVASAMILTRPGPGAKDSAG
jgi:hypothetical protein